MTFSLFPPLQCIANPLLHPGKRKSVSLLNYICQSLDNTSFKCFCKNLMRYWTENGFGCHTRNIYVMSIGIVPRRNTINMFCKFYLETANHAWVVVRWQGWWQQVANPTRWEKGTKKGNLDGKPGRKTQIICIININMIFCWVGWLVGVGHLNLKKNRFTLVLLLGLSK